MTHPLLFIAIVALAAGCIGTGPCGERTWTQAEAEIVYSVEVDAASVHEYFLNQGWEVGNDSGKSGVGRTIAKQWNESVYLRGVYGIGDGQTRVALWDLGFQAMTDEDAEARLGGATQAIAEDMALITDAPPRIAYTGGSVHCGSL